MGIRVNFTDVVSTQREVLPAGKYIVKVTDGELKQSGENAKNPGAEYINWEFTVQQGKYEGQKAWTNTSLLPHALFSIKNLLTAVGHDTSGELDFDIDDVLGKELQIRLTVKPAKDGYDEQNEVKGFYSTGAEQTTMTKSSVLP